MAYRALQYLTAFLAAGIVTGTACSSASPSQPSTDTTPPPTGTVLFEEKFEDANFASRGWYDITSTAISTQEHIEGSVASASYVFAAGATSAGFRPMRRKFTPSSSVYVRFYVKYSTNWVGSGKPYHPHELSFLSTMDDDYTAPANVWLALYVEHNYQNGGKPRIAIQDNKAINTSAGALPNNLIGVTENRSTTGCNGVSESNMQYECYSTGSGWYNDKSITGPVTFQPNPGPGYKGDWNLVEAYFQLNSVSGGVGQADGIMRYWFNGTLIIDRSDIVYRTGARAGLQMNQFFLGPYIGDGSPVAQSMFIDNLVVATAR